MLISDVENAIYRATLSSAESSERETPNKFQDRHLSVEVIETLLDRCSSLSLKEKEDYLLLFRGFLIVYFLKPPHLDQEKIRNLFYPLLDNLFSEKMDSAWYLGKHYRALFCTLLGYEVDLKNFNCSNFQIGSSSQNLEEVECLLILGILAVLKHNDALRDQVVIASYWHLKLFDEKGFFPKSLWTREEGFDILKSYQLHALLFRFSLKVSSLEEFAKTLGVLEIKIKDLSESAEPQFYQVIKNFIQSKLLKKKLHWNKPKEFFDHHLHKSSLLGFGSYSYKNLSISCSVSGKGTSFAALRKSAIEVVAIGPHFNPLGEMQNFGIFREPILKERSFKEVQVKNEKDLFSFSGFTKTIDPSSDKVKYGNTWVHLVCNAKEDIVTFELERIDLKGVDVMNLAFFIKADKAVVDMKYHLSPCSLNRYEGKVCDVVFRAGDDKLAITSNAKDTMQIIPLAGKQHFWGATFLLSFPFYTKDILRVRLK